MMQPIQALTDRLCAELETQTPEAVRGFAAALAALGQGRVAAVLFYGSALRTGALDGVLDFYVLVDDLSAWPQTSLAAWANRRLPPNVEYRELDDAGARLRAKIAILTPNQFRRHAGRSSLDTTIWARFAQPAALVWARDEAAVAVALAGVAEAAMTAAYWAAVLGPQSGTADDYWGALFRETYATELRVDWKGRAGTIVGAADTRYAELLPLAWAAGGITFTSLDGELTPALDRAAGLKAWRARRRLGKPLTVARLIKAVFTFAGAADYAAWKIERHTGVKIELTPWRRRHPILAAPGVAWRLWRAGVLR
jgi:hypothetical protein